MLLGNRVRQGFFKFFRVIFRRAGFFEVLLKHVSLPYLFPAQSHCDPVVLGQIERTVHFIDIRRWGPHILLTDVKLVPVPEPSRPFRLYFWELVEGIRGGRPA